MTEFPPPCTCWSGTGDQPGNIPNCLVHGDSSIPLTETSVSVRAYGEGKPKCGSKAKSTGGVCKKPAGWGTDHVGEGRCRIHGGNTPSGKKSAQKKLAAKARDTYGLPIEIDPADALLQEVWRTQGHVIWLGQKVQELKPKMLAWGKTKVKIGGDDRGTTYEAKYNAFLALYQDERKHLARVSSDAVKAGVEQKRLTLEQHRAELVVQMLGSIFDNLELSPEQLLKLDELVPQALTAISALEASK